MVEPGRQKVKGEQGEKLEQWLTHWSLGDAACNRNTLRPRQNCCNFADNIFKCIFFNQIAWIAIKISLKFVPSMAWHWPGDKPFLLTHICVTRPQGVNLIIFKPCHGKISWVFHVNLPSDKCHETSLMINQFGSGNGLVPYGTKPLPEPMLTQVLWCHTFVQGLWSLSGKLKKIAEFTLDLFWVCVCVLCPD